MRRESGCIGYSGGVRRQNESILSVVLTANGRSGALTFGGPNMRTRDWADYFDLRGEMIQFEIDVRTNNRMMVRTYGVMWFDQPLPFCNRS